MGAESFCFVEEGRNASEIFNRLAEECRREYGDNPYNGTISTCSLCEKPAKTYSVYSPEVEEDAYRFVESQGFGEKWDANYIDLGVCGYELVEVKRKNRKSDAKFQMMYNIYNESGKRVGSAKVKASAEQKAMEYAVKTDESVFIKKEQTVVSGDSRVCDVTVERKFFEEKPRLPRAAGKELVSIHKYMFYGWMAC